MRKRGFTLIEFWIAAALFTSLVSALFFWFRIHYSEKRAIKVERVLFQELERTHLILERLFGKISDPHPFFSQEKDSLIFVFDHGVQQEPLLSNTVLAKLYREKNHLLLALWPDPKKKLTDPCMVYLISDKVDDHFSLSFYHPPSLLPVSPDSQGGAKPLQGWQESWSREYGLCPKAVRVRLNDNHSFVFELTALEKPLLVNR